MPNPPTSRHSSNKQHCHADLKRRILTLALQPGEDLDEVGIGAEYGLSRTPVRDVLRQLSGEGFVDIVGNRGARVSLMDHKTIREFFEVAPMVYASASRLAARHAPQSMIGELQKVQNRFRKAATKGAVKDLVYTNNEFHAMIGAMAGNRYLEASLERLLIDHSRIANTFYGRKNALEGDRLALAVTQHDQLIEAIDTGNEEAAVAITVAHWELSRVQADIFINPVPLPSDSLAS